jgi:hypothetical protein
MVDHGQLWNSPEASPENPRVAKSPLSKVWTPYDAGLRIIGDSASETGGGGGIRTHGCLRNDGFQDRYHRPLGHPSTNVVSE